jgi:hypothetical protein
MTLGWMSLNFAAAHERLSELAALDLWHA